MAIVAAKKSLLCVREAMCRQAGSPSAFGGRGVTAFYRDDAVAAYLCGSFGNDGRNLMRSMQAANS